MTFARTAVSVTANTTASNASLTSVSSTAQLWVGMCVYGTGIQADTVITGISGTTVTISRNATATATGVTVTGQYITQSGTDADPIGLSAMTGVTTLSLGSGNARRTIFDLGTNQLRLQGTLTHDPDLFEIVANVQNGFFTQAGSVYNFGVARVANGQTAYSKGTGLVSTYPCALAGPFGVYFDNGTVTWNGGGIKTAGPIYQGLAAVTTNSYDCVWQMWSGGDSQWRALSAPTFNALTVQGITNAVLLFMSGGFNAFSVKFQRAVYQTAAGGGGNITVSNPVFAGNQNTRDFITNQAANTQQVTTIRNPDRFPVLGKLSNNAYADFPTVQSLDINISNSASVAVGASEVVAYLRDSNNGSRKNSLVTNYVDDRVYVGASSAAGAINLGNVLTMAGVHNNLIDGTINLDYRSNFGNASSDFNLYLGGYSYLPAVTRQTLMGNGGKNVLWTMFDDTQVTLARTAALALLGTKVAIDATAKTVTVLANASYSDLYDACKAFKYQGTATAFETPVKDKLLVTAAATKLTLYAGWTLVVNAGVTLSADSKYTELSCTNCTNAGTIAGAVTISTLLTSAATGVTGSVALLAGARWDLAAPGTLPAGTVAAGATVRLVGAVGGVVDGRAITWAAATANFENTSGQAVTLKLLSTQQAPQLLATSGAVTIDTTVAMTFTGLDPDNFGAGWYLRYRLQSGGAWTLVSGTGNDAQAVLPPGVYDVEARAAGYDWRVTSFDTAQTSVVALALAKHISNTSTAQYLMPYNATLEAIFAYDPATLSVAVTNTTGAIVQPGFAELYRAMQRIMYMPALVWLWTAPVTANSSTQKILIPTGNPITMFLTAASTASVKLTCPVIHADSGASADDRVRGNPSGYSIVLGSPATAESAGLAAQIIGSVRADLALTEARLIRSAG